MVKVKYSDDKLIDLLRAKAQSLGRTPTAKDVWSDGNMPSSMTYSRRFGSWDQALEAAGLSVNRHYYKCTGKELIGLLKAKAKSLGRTPTKRDADYDSLMPSSETYANKFGSWNRALAMAGLLANQRRYTDEELIGLLRMKAESLGRTPTSRDLRSDDSMPSPETYATKFGSWNRALEMAGLLANQRRYTDEKLIGLLRMKAESLGRTPTSRDLRSDDSMPNIKVYTNRFGSWNQALEMAGFLYNRRGRKK